MNDHNDYDDRQAESERREPKLKEDAAPDAVGVYERPERTTLSPAVIAVIALVLLVIAAAVIYMLVI